MYSAVSAPTSRNRPTASPACSMRSPGATTSSTICSAPASIAAGGGARSESLRADRTRARARPVHRHRRSRDRRAIGARRGAARVVGVDFAGAMLRVGHGEAAQRAARPTASRSFAATPTRIPVADASVDAVTIAFGIRNVEQHRRGVRGDAPGAAAGRPARDSRVRDPDDAGGARRAISGTSITCCRASAALSRGTTRRTATCRRRSARSRRPTSL